MKMWRIVYFVLELNVPLSVCEEIHENLYPRIQISEDQRLELVVDVLLNDLFEEFVYTGPEGNRLKSNPIIQVSKEMSGESIWDLHVVMTGVSTWVAFTFVTNQTGTFFCHASNSDSFERHELVLALQWPILREQLREAFLFLVEQSQGKE